MSRAGLVPPATGALELESVSKEATEAAEDALGVVAGLLDAAETHRRLCSLVEGVSRGGRVFVGGYTLDQAELVSALAASKRRGAQVQVLLD